MAPGPLAGRRLARRGLSPDPSPMTTNDLSRQCDDPACPGPTDIPAQPGTQPHPPGPFAFCATCGAPTERRLVEGRLRPACTGCGQITFLDPKLAVAAIIAREGRILLGKRGPGTRAPGKWSFPAGFVERGEVVEAAAAREVFEETGLTVRIGPLVGLFSEAGEAVALAVYAAEVDAGEAAANDDLTEVGWFALDALPELAFARDTRIIAAWRGMTAG